MYLKFVCLTLLVLGGSAFRSQTGFIDLNSDLNVILEELRHFLPINLLINAIEQYQVNTQELSYELEACFLNLHGAVNFADKESFAEFQKDCVTSYFEFFSFFEVMRSMVFKFFSDTCPEELIETCTGLIERFDVVAQKIEDHVYQFMTFLLDSDKTMQTLDPLLPSIRAQAVETVVMKSLSAINQESFYNQLNEILQSRNEEIALETIAEDAKPKAMRKPLDTFGLNSIQDDPIQNPDRYLLEGVPKPVLKDQYIVSDGEHEEEGVLEKLIKL